MMSRNPKNWKTIVTNARRDLMAGSIPWFAQAVGVTQWKRIWQVRLNKGVPQAKFLAASTDKWVDIDGLSCLIGED